MRTQKSAVIWPAVLACLIGFTGCVRDFSDDRMENIRSNENSKGEYDFRPADELDFSQIIPDDWVIEKEDENTVLIKDTDLRVILSTGFAPDDYFMPNGRVNDEKYAESYALIRIEEFDAQAENVYDWHEFLTKNFPEVNDYKIQGNDGSYAIEPIEFSGVMLGEKSVMISKENKMLVVSLHCQKRQSQDAEAIFWQITDSLR